MEAPANNNNNNNKNKLPPSCYKGVVPQPNGRWGAQIYERHRRVWLGTFGAEIEAAKAYDVAVLRFRGLDAVTNFKPFSESGSDGTTELSFLASHTKDEIVDMLRKNTYDVELRHSLRNHAARRTDASTSSSLTMMPLRRARSLLFEKVLTSSDVGKLNRLVIPKHHAEKHLPMCGDCGEGGVLLHLVDDAGKIWRFRYSYWNSSQSYVLTKGWSRFVKEKGLNTGDVVSFSLSADGEDEQTLFIGCSTDENRCQELGGEDGDDVGRVRLFGVYIAHPKASNGSGIREESDGD